MKKLTKLSLVAALAVAGMTSASASSLEEAVKGVEISGSVSFEHGITKKGDADHVPSNEYGADLSVTVPVNELVKATVSGEVTGVAAHDPSTEKQPELNAFAVTEAYFTFEKDGYTLSLGKQDFPSPVFDANSTSGILTAAVPGLEDNLSVVGAYANSSTEGPQNVAALIFNGEFEGVKPTVSFTNRDDYGFAYTAGVEGDLKVAEGTNVGFTLGYAGADGDEVADDSYSLEATASAKVNMFDVKVGFNMAGEGGNASLGSGSIIDFEGEQVESAADTMLWGVTAGADPVENLNVGFGYVGSSQDSTKTTKHEGSVNAEYTVIKNFTVSGVYSYMSTTVDEGDAEGSHVGTVTLEYSF